METLNSINIHIIQSAYGDTLKLTRITKITVFLLQFKYQEVLLVVLNTNLTQFIFFFLGKNKCIANTCIWQENFITSQKYVS